MPMRVHCVSRLFVALAYATLLFAGARAAAAEDCPHCRLAAAQAKSGDGKVLLAAAEPYKLPAFRTNKQSEFLDGALYDEHGQVICVLPESPGAYVYTGETLSRPVAAVFCTAVQQDLKERKMADIADIGLTNNDLLRRLIWLSGEGGCNPADTVCVPNQQNCSSGESDVWGSRFYAYTIKNLRKRFKSDDAMLRGAATDSTGSRFDEYFVKATGNTRFIVPVAKDPGKWGSNPAPADAPGCGNSTDCWTQSRISRCLQDVITAQLDTTDAKSPFKDMPKQPDQWAGGVGSGNCPGPWPGVIAHSWAGMRMTHCFHN